MIKNLEGKTLIYEGDQSICKKFHEGSPKIKSQCEKKLNVMMSKLNFSKDHVIYKCDSGLVYIAVAIIVNGEHIANLLTGHVFFEKPNVGFFEEQANELGYNEDNYINLVKKIPVIPKEKVKDLVYFLCKVGKIIGEVAYNHLKELEVNKKLSGSYIEINSIQHQLRVAEEQLKEQYDELQRMAYYDALTGLPNSNFIQKELQNYIDNNNGRKFGAICIGLDNFKNINDTFGHKYGDGLLKKISNELRLMLDGKCTVSRIGGDEFLVLIRGIRDKIEVEKTIQDILINLSKMWILEEKEFFISASIGVSIYPDDAEDVTKINRNVDIAMNKAKHLGKNCYVFFEKSMHEEILRKTEMEKELRNAIKNNELSLNYQPQVDIKTGKIVSLEVLLRWNSRKFGCVSPVEFIKLAEETGLIIPIGEWVLKSACLQHIEWKRKEYEYDFIAINVSVIQLQKNNFLDIVKKILNETKMKPEFLELEITESVMMQTLDANLKVLNELKEMGIRIALDDFGTGYSSLNYLKCLPINTLKLDKSFIDGLCKSSYEEMITQEMIKLAHRMDLDVIAEGVELEEQLQSLMEKECNRIQGYYFSRPFPAEKIEPLLDKGTFSIDHRILS
jgi:diguanylate cyclase (GGDEF)-like protein